MKRLGLVVVLLALPAVAQVSVGSSARASKPSRDEVRDEGAAVVVSGQRWSAVGPRTVAQGSNQLEVTAGFPGLSVGYLRGVAPQLNLGVRGSFHYGVEGMIRDLVPGVKLQGLLKVRFFDEGRVSLGLTFEPGLLVHTPYLRSQRLGFAFPVGLRLGIAASSALNVAVTLDLPMWVEFGVYAGFNLPILTGAGVEYFVTSNLAVLFRLRMGPTLRSYQVAEFTFDGAMGIGYRF